MVPLQTHHLAKPPLAAADSGRPRGSLAARDSILRVGQRHRACAKV